MKKTQALAESAAESADAARDLIVDQQQARQHEHRAAVEAVFHELASIGEPMRLVLEHGNLNVRVPFALVAAYRQVLGPLYRGLPPHLGRQLAKTYSLLDIQRLAFERMTINVQQLKLIYNDDLVPTMAELHAHLHELGRDVPEGPAAIGDGDISLNQQMVATAKDQFQGKAGG